jgi:hypothetical protein
MQKERRKWRVKSGVWEQSPSSLSGAYGDIQLTIPHGQLPMLNAQCSTLNAQCSMLNPQCSILNAQCSILNAQLSTDCITQTDARAIDGSVGGQDEPWVSIAQVLWALSYKKVPIDNS